MGKEKAKEPKKTPQEIAHDEMVVIRDVLYVLGHATAGRIAEETSLPLATVGRRLTNGGPGIHLKQYQRFAYEKETKLWSLTALAWRESEQHLKG